MFITKLDSALKEVGRTSRLVAVETSQGPLRYLSTPLDCLSAALYAVLDHTLRQLADVPSNENMIIIMIFWWRGGFLRVTETARRQGFLHQQHPTLSLPNRQVLSLVI